MIDRNVISLGVEVTAQCLFQRAQEHEDGAWERLVELYSPLLENWCLTWNIPRDTSSDICQEVLIQVQKGLSAFKLKQKKGAFRKWLRQITHNMCAEHWRKHPKHVDRAESIIAIEGQQLEGNDVPMEEQEKEVSILYRRALSILSSDVEETTWKAFWRVVIDEQQPAEAAMELGITPTAVSSAKWRVLYRLRKEMRVLIE